jgi:hypothetical protein
VIMLNFNRRQLKKKYKTKYHDIERNKTVYPGPEMETAQWAKISRPQQS